MSEALTQSDRDRLRDHYGLTDETIERAGLYSVTSHEGAELVGRPATALHDYSGVAIPNVLPGEDKPRQIRIRRTNPDIDIKPDGERKERDKYVTALTTPNRFYFPSGTQPEWLSDPLIPILIVEGEFKAIRVFQAMLAVARMCLVIAVLGVWSWRGKTGKEPSANGGFHNTYGLIADFERINWKGREVTICFDAITGKPKTDRSVKQARAALADTLAGFGATVRLAEIPQEDKAIDDYFNRHGDEVGLALLDSAKIGGGRNIFHARDRKKYIQPAQAIIEGVAYRRLVTILEGQAGNGKSHILTDLAATAAQSFRVLFIANESPEELDARLDAWEAFHGLSLPGLHILPEVAGLFDPVRIAAIVEAIQAIGGVDLIAHDILSNEFEGRKEENENMAVAFEAAKRITRACDCAYTITAHTGWSGEHIRGGSQAYGSARRVLQVENADEIITLKVQKANVTRGMESRRFRIIQLPLERIPNADPKRAEEYTVLMPAESILNDAGPLSKRQLEVLRILALPVFAAVGAYAKDIEAHSIPKATVNVATSALLKRLLVEDVPHKPGMVKVSDAGWTYLHALDDGQKAARKPIEQALNKGSLNWTVCSNGGQETNSLVHTSSHPVHSQFNAGGSLFSSAPPPYRGLTIEQAELEQADKGAEREW